ncbi:hypothetical protein HDU76_001861 [Blyttiomyces sp. JEL0837]|nr:hypothetical protein HDU76_001861 [Blyttiomyces sp. JEL0837]
MNPHFRFPEYLLPDILDNLKFNFRTFQAIRSVSKTWRDNSDRVRFRNIVLKERRNIDAFIDWIATPATDNDNQPTQKPKTPVLASVIAPKCRDVLRHIHYVEIQLKRVKRKVQYRIKIKEALLLVPNLKGAVYGDRFDHRDWMLLNEVLMEKKEKITHFDISYQTTDSDKHVEVNRHAMPLLKSNSLQNLRVLNLDFGSSLAGFRDARSPQADFALSVLKHLAKVDIMAVFIRRKCHSSSSLTDLLSCIPESLKLLKLDIKATYALNCASPQSNVFQQCRLYNVLGLHVIFESEINRDEVFSTENARDIVLQMQQILSWIFPNLDELKVNLNHGIFRDSHVSAVFRKNETPNFSTRLLRRLLGLPLLDGIAVGSTLTIYTSFEVIYAIYTFKI